MSKLIAIDWGTSSFRAFLFSGEGTILSRVSSDRGILTVSEGGFEEVLREQLTSFGDTNGLPIICSGMITSRQGWLETPYVECPAGAEQLADNLREIETGLGTIYMVPGVKQYSPEPDIMRGEETQLMGVQETMGKRLYLLPGTHSKWAWVKEGSISGFSTFVTGDLFNALLNQTIFKAAAGIDGSESGFRAGVGRGYREALNGSGLLNGLFAARVQSILEIYPEAGTESYLSGLLIGTEIGDAAKSGFTARLPITVIGSENLADRYLMALDELKLEARPAPQDAAPRGLHRIATLAGLI